MKRRLRFHRTALVCVVPALIMGLVACAEPPDIAPLEKSIVERPSRLPSTHHETAFGKAVAAAVLESPDFGRSQAALRMSEADSLAESGLRYPQISVGLRQGAGSGFSVTPFAALSQVVFDAGAGKARRRAAEARVLGGKAALIDAAAFATLNAVDVWAEVVTARRAQTSAQKAIAELELIVARIEKRSAGGASSTTDLLIAQSRMASERVSISEANARVARAEAIFSDVFGSAPAKDLSFPPPAPQLPVSDVMSSPVLQQTEAERLAAEADLAAARSGILPAVGLQVSDTGASSPAAGLSVDQTIAPTNARSSRIAAAEARLQARQIDLEAVRKDVVRRLNLIKVDQISATERYRTAVAATEINLANLDVASQQFDVGSRSLIELLDAQRETANAVQQRIAVEKDQIMLGYEALAITGDILDLFAIRF